MTEQMTRAERAMQIWQILITAAHDRRTLTYGRVAALLGFKGAGVISQFLNPIMGYCEAKDLPPLTVLVVNQDTGLPGERPRIGWFSILGCGSDRHRYRPKGQYRHHQLSCPG